MLKVIDRTSGTAFDLRPGTKISIDLTNPFLTDQGSMSLDLSLPRTPINLKLLNFPHRTDRQSILDLKKDVIIFCGSYQKTATLQIKEGPPDSITCLLLINESEFYSKSQNITLQTIFQNIIRTDFSGSNASKRDQWVNYLEMLMISSVSGVTDEEITCFPVCTYVDNSVTYRSNFTAQVLNDVSVEEVSMINYKAYRPLLSRNSRTHVDKDGKTISWPVGFNVTPFLKLPYVLKTIFNYFGYTLDWSSIHSISSSFDNLVVLNNIQDSIMNGNVVYSQLVPSCTASSFITAFMHSFGCVFSFNHENKTVKATFYKEILDTISSIPEKWDFTKYKTSSFYPTFENYKTLKLTCNHDLEAISSSFDSYQKFRLSYPNITFKNYFNVYTRTSELTDAYGIYFGNNLCGYWKLSEATDNRSKVLTQISADIFDYYLEEDNYEAYELTCDRSALQMVLASLGKKIRLNGDGPDTIECPNLLLLPYVGSTLMLNDYIKSDDDSTTVADKANNPIMFCFFSGSFCNDDPNTKNINYISYTNESWSVWATTHAYDNLGNKMNDFSLAFHGIDGLYNFFWKGFDDILHKSWQPVSIGLNLSEKVLNEFQMVEPLLIDGQPLLPEELKYELSDDGVKIIDTKFRTLKIYED